MAIGNTVAELGWRLISQDRSRMIIREPMLQGKALMLPTQIEVKVQPLSDAIGVEICGTPIGVGIVQSPRVQHLVIDFDARLRKHLDRIGTPEQQAQRQWEAEQRAAEQREAALRAAQELEEERRAAEERAAQHRWARQMASIQREAERRAAEQAAQAQTTQEQTVQEQAAPPTPPVPAPASGGAGSLSEELERLARLHQQGILTDDEFRQAKQKLLGI